MTAPREPWRRISLRVIDRAEALSWDQAVASPCASCEVIACCTHVKLHDFDVSSLLHLDYARYLLNFERIVLGITPDGQWHAYYRYPCRHLDRAASKCTVHDTPTQPNICQNFSPYGCWYRTAFAEAAGPALIQIDRPRLDWIVAHAQFADDRTLTAMPAIDDVRAAFVAMPVIEDPDPGPAAIEADPVYASWKQSAVTGVAPPAPPPRTFLQLAEPCTGCAAHCCTALIFPQGAPAAHSQLDFYRYALGFPGIELGYGETGWTFIVRTQCRHLTGGRCGVYGTDARPLQCRYYDAHKCGYKSQFGAARPEAFVRIRYAEFDAFAAGFTFDDNGMTTATPTVEDVRAAVEAGWRAPAG
jgi:Fe-S-cluster containining protein